MSQFLYFKTLKESFQLVFKNQVLFVPLLISTLLGLAAIPLFTMFNFVEDISLLKLALLIFSAFILGAVNIMIHLWLYALIKNVIEKKKVSFSKSFKQGLQLAPKVLMVLLIILGLMLLAVVVGGIAALVSVGVFYLSSVIGFIFVAVLIILSIIFLFVAGLSLSYITSIIIMEDTSALETVKLSYSLFMKHKGLTLKLGLMAFLVSMLAYLPLLIFQFQSFFLDYQMLAQTPMFSLYSQLFGIPVIIASLIMNIYYILAYLKMKKGSSV